MWETNRAHRFDRKYRGLLYAQTYDRAYRFFRYAEGRTTNQALIYAKDMADEFVDIARASYISCGTVPLFCPLKHVQRQV